MVMKYMNDQKTVDYMKLAAAIEIMIGVSRNVAHEYIDTLKDFGFIRVKDGTVILNEKEANPGHDQG